MFDVSATCHLLLCVCLCVQQECDADDTEELAESLTESMRDAGARLPVEISS